jgi:hypothetical protein
VLNATKRGTEFMATVANVFTYQFDWGDAGIQPQASQWVSFGPSDVYKDSAVVITAHPDTAVAGTVGPTHAFAALQVTDTFVHYYPTVGSGGFVFTETHVGAWLLNTGSTPIRYAAVKVAVIKA